MDDLHNLRALAEGRVSGRISEWPALRGEARKALMLIETQQKEIEEWKLAYSHLMTNPDGPVEIEKSMKELKEEINRLNVQIGQLNGDIPYGN